MVGENSCLRDYGSNEDWAKVCPTIKDSLDDEPENPGQPVEPCQAGQNGNPARLRRQDGGGSGSCPLIPGDNGPGKNIEWETGPSGPECEGKDHCGGEVCKGYYCDPDPDINHPPDYYDPKDPENPHGTSSDIPEPTSTSTSTSTASPTSTPKPPVKTIDICLGSSTSTTWQLTIHNYLVYPPDSACNGLYITDPSIGSSTPVCDIPKDEVTFNYCSEDGDAKFVDEGPEVLDGCGFQLELDGKKYTPKQLDPDDDDNNPCAYTCASGGTISFVRGLLLFEEIPECDQEGKGL